MANRYNSNTNVFSHLRNKIRRNNLVGPEIVVRHLWMEESEPINNGVEIIELNSSDNSSEASVEERPRYAQAWSYVSNSGFSDSDNNYYQVNERARQKRRIQNATDISSGYYIYDYNDTDDYEQPHVTNIQQNCFTIINNHILKTDSSSDEEYAVGVIESENCHESYWDHVYNEGLDVEEEKRMVWIYSFGNRRLLTENTFEHVNIPGQDTISPNSSSDGENRPDNSIATCRIASPIPHNYIPRLDLSIAQTLSTVTEVSDKKYESSDEVLKPKRLNNWLTSRVNVNKYNKVLDWMALSPRNKKRKFTDIGVITDELPVTNKFHITNAEGDVDNTVKQDKRPEHKRESPVKAKEDIHKIIDIDSIETLTEESESKSNDVYVVDASKAPHIDINPKFEKPKITSPIDKLESNNWIADERKIEKQMDMLTEFCKLGNDCDGNETQNEEDLSQRLFKQNLSFVKPSRWSEYMPIATSRNSLHLSLSCSSIESTTNWFKCLINVFRCCKSEF